AVDPEPYLQIAKGRPESMPAVRADGVAGPKGKATGSGFVIAARQVVTNAHVVEGCKKIDVTDRGPARVKALDAKNDLALL
ncbi:serine protease, partial [Mycobacterium tuberculosis]|uniref:trypsin-like peptidase domain-containing protein n=1 Tax=Mycobacterium tuberculosis TaxID=1773 RepID=UPI000E3771B5